jgi:pyridoxamine 5'-phosphate oxidase-like protein
MPKTGTADRVDRTALLDFLRARDQAVLATRKRAGGVQMSPVTFGVDGEGRVVVSTYPQRAKVTNVRRDPAVSLCVLSADWNDPWRKDPRAPHRSQARGGPLHEGRNDSAVSTPTGTSTGRP